MKSASIEQLQALLQKKAGTKKGTALYEKYRDTFPSHYFDECAVETAVVDLLQLEKLSANNPLVIDLYSAPVNEEQVLYLKLYQYAEPIPLSDILPMLENMGLSVKQEHPYEISFKKSSKKQSSLFISDFSVKYKKDAGLDIANVENNFEDALMCVRLGQCENDGFNKLVLGAGLSWRQISILRAYAKYLQQARFRFSQPYIERTLADHADCAADLVSLFELKFDPKQSAKSAAACLKLEATILKKFESITSLDEDRILRRFLSLIKATLRTNYFQPGENGKPKDYISFKLSSKNIPELPLPCPLYEVFVYSPRFEGIHLRSEKVARGGIRWSDRPEDFRTEVLGLMKAQKVKNSVIVPSGAKGGFVLKALPAHADRETTQKEVIFCYKSFIRGLLDLTDNLTHQGKVVRPKQVVCFDDEDPYLVVAADKGTSTFSDIANGLSQEYHFWLGDAFASGGSAGYDHKKMGITARGAWESIKRHFRELEIDLEKTSITVVGIGDMSGDVFGNGMIYSRHLKLCAAFDHRHIFIDPDPDPEKSYLERVRLFNLPTSSWENYNAKLISKGGGIYSRALKSITLSPQAKKMLGTDESTLSPTDLVRVILQAPVDLLYNGGIGTYVKASTENHADVGDKTNEYCRINGEELRCKVVGEGGNLGFTQLGRVEYALKGGYINTDFIDNSAGVDCSDHEVNIKILLNKEVEKGNLTEKQRNTFLFKMTDDVGKLVLSDNYNQALALSFLSQHAAHYSTLYLGYIKALEANGTLNRAVEFLPDDKKLTERKSLNQGLTRPELAVLLSYTKIFIKNELLKSTLPENEYYISTLEKSFPVQMLKPYGSAMEAHPLHREIISTQLANGLVDIMGVTFIYRLQTETGATVDEVVRAYTIASHIFEASTVHRYIDSLSFKITMQLQFELMHHVRQLLNISTRWFLHNNRLKADMKKTIEHYQSGVGKLEEMVSRLMVGATRSYVETRVDQFVQAGLEKNVATRIVTLRAMYTALNIIEVSTQHHFDLFTTAHMYFTVGGFFNLVWFRDQISTDSREGHWNTLARLVLRDELDTIQRTLTTVILNQNKKEHDVEKAIKRWTKNNTKLHERWEKFMTMLHESTSFDYSMFFIALQELASMVKASALDV